MDPHLFRLAGFLSRPPGFYLLMAAMIVSTALVPFGLTDIVTYGLSVAAILITGVVLIQGYRDTAAIHAKLDEIVLSLNRRPQSGGGARTCRRQRDQEDVEQH